MKNLKVFSLLTIAILALASCGSGRFTSARYGNRDYVKVDPNEVVKTEPVKAENVKASKQTNNVKPNTSQETAVVSPISAPATAQNEVNATTASSTTKPEVSDKAIADETTTPVSESSETAKVEEIAQPENDATTGGDTELILLVILAILIPPLAVFLYDGSATTMFWITLILCILSGGFIFGFGGYLFGLWGLAILLAILHILEII